MKRKAKRVVLGEGVASSNGHLVGLWTRIKEDHIYRDKPVMFEEKIAGKRIRLIAEILPTPTRRR